MRNVGSVSCAGQQETAQREWTLCRDAFSVHFWNLQSQTRLFLSLPAPHCLAPPSMEMKHIYKDQTSTPIEPLVNHQAKNNYFVSYFYFANRLILTSPAPPILLGTSSCLALFDFVQANRCGYCLFHSACMSTTDNDQTAPLGLKSRLWRTFRAFAGRRDLFVSESNLHLSRRLGRKRNTKPSTMQPGVGTATSTTTTATATSATLYADAGKVNPVEWFPIYQGCVEHFVNVAQYRPLAQSLAAHINILLPYQRTTNAVLEVPESTTNNQSESNPAGQHRSSSRSAFRLISLTPYIRRLVITATDAPAVMQELFGDDWVKGVGTVLAQERVNYLFSAKSGGWLKTKAQYESSPHETVPFLRPLRDPQEEELRAAEAHWSEWLAMEDWMVGPRSPFEDLPGN